MIDKIDILAEEWADFILRCFEKSPIGWPKGMNEERTGSSVPSSLCPEVIMKPRVSHFDNMYKNMSAKWKYVIDKKYLKREKLSRKEYSILENIHHYINGSLVDLSKHTA